MRRLAIFTFAVVLLGIQATALAGGRLQQRFFLSPTKNISCELDYTPAGAVNGLGTQAFCETFSPARSVTLKANGSMKICNGSKCIGDPPQNAKPLAYGKSVGLGPFKCTSTEAAMVCGTGSKGFSISKSGVTTP